jgi:HEAT repeat protein
MVDLKQHYLDLFRSALREGAIATRADLPDLDLASLEAIFAALNSSDDAEVIASLDLLEGQGKSKLIPALVLYHPSKPVVLRAFDLFAAARREDFLPIAERLLASPDPEIRAAALRARSVVRTDEAVLRRAAEDSNPRVRAVAAVGLVSGGWVTDEAQRVLDELLASQSPEAGYALARAIREQPSPIFAEVLLELAEAPEMEVLGEVARAMAAMPDPRFLPALLPMLGQREVRGAARAAFLAHAEAGLQFLDQATGDHALPQELRRHLPRTISQFPAEAAAPVLLRHLVAEPDGMVRFKILRGLGRVRADNPGLRLDAGIVARAIDATIEGIFRLTHWRLVLERGARLQPERATAGHELLARLLRDKEVHALERLFRLLGLRFAGEDVRQIYRGLQSPIPRLRASSRELLENLLEPPLKDAVLAAVEELPAEQRLGFSRPYYLPAPIDYEGLLALTIERGSESLRCLAAHHVAELGLVEFRERLRALRRSETGFFVTRVLDRALAMLSAEELRRA